jgi:hypothetical protein
MTEPNAAVKPPRLVLRTVWCLAMSSPAVGSGGLSSGASRILTSGERFLGAAWPAAARMTIEAASNGSRAHRRGCGVPGRPAGAARQPAGTKM